MNFDLRLPIGILFTLYGVLLTGYGFATNGSQEYTKHSLGININLTWGAVLLAFGLFMLMLALRGRKAAAEVPPAAAGKPKTNVGA